MDTLLHEHEMQTVATPIKEGLSFLSENPEAFGLVSDAYPVVADEWMIAAHGGEDETGAVTIPFPSTGGTDALYDTVFKNILPRSPVSEAVLTASFGATAGGQACPISRYAAVLSEALTAHLLSGLPAEISHEELNRRLSDAVLRGLEGLRSNVGQDGESALSAHPYEVSLAVCRIRHLGGGRHALDLLTAGDFRAYLLDKNGLRPLRLLPTNEFSLGDLSSTLGGRRIDLYHTEPFAILLLSGSACTVNAAEQQSLRGNPGLAWRYRMRLEASVLRILTSLSQESDFSARATQFFTGRASGRDSASGAVLLRLGESPFSAFRADCLSRLRHLEDMIALLPDGYDPTRVPSLPSRVETEHSYIRRLLEQEHGLAERTADALRVLALEKLTSSSTSDEILPPPEDVPELRRLTVEDVEAVYRVYDAENEDDYVHIEENREMLREQLSSHWVTLRPILLGVRHPASVWDDEEEQTDEDVAYTSLLRLNARLSKHYTERHRVMTEVANKLEKQASALREQGEDWLHGRGDEGRAPLWADTAAADLTSALRSFADTYERTEDEYRYLLETYIAERDVLFARDAEQSAGFFADEWDNLLHGRLSEDRANTYRSAIAAATKDSTYTSLWDDLYVISRGTGARIRRVQDRSTDRRAVRDISEQAEFRIAAIRASAYRDADWGEMVCDLLDTAHRASYFTMVRRWQETRELMARQAAAYEEYRKLYDETV